jgi:hypothetical protein
MKRLALISLLVLSIAACKKDPKDPEPQPAPTPTTGNLSVEFEPVVGPNSLVFSTQWYTNNNNDSFKVTIFRYYISNVVLTKSDNSTYSVPNFYYKIDHAISTKQNFTMSGIPVADYKAIQFMVGVDSTHNCSGAKDGELSVSDMFWSWSTGYIFAKMEGTSPKSTATGKILNFHIGGFTTPNIAMRTVNLGFGTSVASVDGTGTPEVHLKSDLAKWFYGPGGTIDFATMNTVISPGANAKKIADNYAASFTFEHVHN